MVKRTKNVLIVLCFYFFCAASFCFFACTAAIIFAVKRPPLPELNFGFTGAFLGTVVVLILVFAVSLLLLLAIS